MNKYDIVEMIDQGAYGIVLKACNKQTGEYGKRYVDSVAIKKFKDVEDDEVVVRSIQRQVKMLKKLRSNYVVELKEALRRKGRVYLVFEYMQKNVLNLLEDSLTGLDVIQQLTQPSLIQKIIYKTVKAIHFLHSNNVAHRDIKPENLLISQNSNEIELKLCDFGFTRFMKTSAGEHLTDYVATRWYRSPQLLVRDYYGLAVDMWAIGCIMGELFDGQPMFAGQNEIDQLFLIMKSLGGLTRTQDQCLHKHFKGVKFPPIKIKQSLNLKYAGKANKNQLSFMKQCLKIDPEQRLTAEEALKHPYLADMSQSQRNLQSTPLLNSIFDEYQAPRYIQRELQPTPRIFVNNKNSVTQLQKIQTYKHHKHQQSIQQSWLIRNSRNQQSIEIFKHDDHLQRKDITHKIQLQLFPSQGTLKRPKLEGENLWMNSNNSELKSHRLSKQNLEAKIRQNLHLEQAYLQQTSGLGKASLSKMILNKRSIPAKSNSQPFMTIDEKRPIKRFKILKKSQELRIVNSLSRPQLLATKQHF